VCSYDINYFSGTKRNSAHSISSSVGLDLERGTRNNLDIICPICLESFHADDNVAWSLYLFSCPHVFHLTCIQLWLASSHYDCPCCRGNFQRPRSNSTNRDNEVNGRIHGNDIVTLSDKRKQIRFCISHGLMLPS
jgi:hypothetical protein